MFGIKHNECVGFDSRWRVKKVLSETSTQTTEFAVSQKGTNTQVKTSTEVQTVTDQPLPKIAETDMKKLAEWLSKIYPKVTREIDNANNSQVFKGYRLHDDSVDVNCKLLQSINISNTTESDRASKISGMSWNQTGQSLAVTCNYEHHSWCHHSGHILIYTLNREDKIPDLPRKKLTTESCVMTLKFHPIHPAIIAAGTFSGGICVWNTQNDEDGDIVGNANAHEEAVTQVSWINDVYSAKTVILATSSTDGLLKLWNFNLANNSLVIKAKYKIKAPLLANMHRNTPTPEHIQQKSSRGIICFDFSKHRADLFVVGSEGGLVVQCSVLGTSELKGSTPEEPLLDPVFKYYEPHEGEISSVSITPNRNDMFMTSGTDGEIRIYMFGQEEPAQLIFIKNPLNDLTFVPYEDNLVAGCGANGILEIFNIVRGKPLENITTEKVKKQVLTSLAVNRSKTNIVALGNVNGDLQLWSVPWHLFATNS